MKTKKIKTKEQRTKEVSQLLLQLSVLGIPVDHDGVQEFTKISNDFMEHGISMSGKIKLTGFQRVLQYIYSKQSHIESRAVLEYDKNV